MAARASKGSSPGPGPDFREFPRDGRAGGATVFPGLPTAGGSPDPKATRIGSVVAKTLRVVSRAGLAWNAGFVSRT